MPASARRAALQPRWLPSRAARKSFGPTTCAKQSTRSRSGARWKISRVRDDFLNYADRTVKPIDEKSSLTPLKRYFGTDGVRGRVGEPPITPELVLKLGYAAGRVLAAESARRPGETPAVLIGKDTRISGYLLEAALEAGLSAAGVDVYLSGPLPTPAVAYLTRALRLTAGIVISASHNAYDDNGIKFFSGAGAKLPDAMEHEIEREMDEPITCVRSADLGKARRVGDAPGRYIEFCKSTFPTELDLKGWRIVVDCAHGAAYHVAPPVFHELGADVIPIGAEPNGTNISAGVGATSPAHLIAAVAQHKAQLGIALDGDGDRVVMVDASWRMYDGDELLYVITMDYR